MMPSSPGAEWGSAVAFRGSGKSTTYTTVPRFATLASGTRLSAVDFLEDLRLHARRRNCVYM